MGGWTSWGGRSGDNEQLLFFIIHPVSLLPCEWDYIGDWWVNFWRTTFREAQLQLAVVCNCSLCIDHHSKGHQQSSWHAAKSRCTFATSSASWYLCMLFARSGCLIASSNNVRYSLCIFHPTSVTKNTGAHTYLGCKNTVREKPRLTGTNVTALQVWASSPCWTQTNWNGYLCLACFWWMQECFLCPSCPALVWKRWFEPIRSWRFWS